MLSHTVLGGLWVSAALTLAALFVFGYGKGRLTGIRPLRGGLRTVVIGGLAAAAAFGIAGLIS
jgi:VIT1/CCC1 family predicted Fe2+/Mn2+ transporter